MIRASKHGGVLLAAGALALAVGTAPALAGGAAGPLADGRYESSSPSVEITVIGPTHIYAVVRCGARYWDSPELTLTPYSVRYRRLSRIRTTGKAATKRALVSFSANYSASSGTFIGVEHLSGTRCAKMGYLAQNGRAGFGTDR